MDPGSGADDIPKTTRRGGLLVFLFGLALLAIDVALVLLFWKTHTRMVGLLMYAPAGVGLLFMFAGLNAIVRRP